MADEKTAKTKTKRKKSDAPKSGRVFNIVQYECSPITGQSFNFSEQNIINGCNHQSISRYAYIRHDADHYSEQDCEEFLERHSIQKTINDVKPAHWHIVLEVPNKCSVQLIAKWFGVPENQVEVPNERGKTPITTRGMNKVFLQCVGYLTHSDIRQQALDKHLYDPSEVKANFDWQTEVAAEEALRTRYGRELTEKEWYRNEVVLNGLRPKDIMRNPLTTTIYTNDFQMLDKLRKKYLRENAPMPTTRFNYYIYSDDGRAGKGLLSKAFARGLYPELADDDLFFCVGGKNVSFDGYDGQPVIIYNDVRPVQLLNLFGDIGAWLDSLDIHPTRKDEHIKFGSICLTNTVNIFNCVVPYRQFFEELMGEEKNKMSQICGRFPMVIPVSADDFGILINKGIIGQGALTEYFEHQRVVSHLKKVHETLSAREDLVKQIDAQTVKPLIDSHNSIASLTTNRNDYGSMTDDEILAQFNDCGDVMTQTQIAERENMKLDAYRSEYNMYLEEFFNKHESLRGTDNYPGFEWWLLHIKHKGVEVNERV